MKKMYQMTEVSVILFDNQDMLTASGDPVSDEAIIKDRTWTAASPLSGWTE